jgi:thiamine biosynthesis lipoprotein
MQFSHESVVPISHSSASNCVKLACNAMATRFEIVLYGDNPVALRAAGEEAIEEIHQLEARLSLYQPSSEIAHVNARAAREPVRVTPDVFALLEHAKELTNESSGAFDITIGPLVRCWGFMGGTGKMPSEDELADARAKVGMHHVQLNRQDFTVRFSTEGVVLDLGAIGKGYAIDRASEILREAGVTSGVLHSGTSTVSAIGTPPGEQGWKIAIENPANRAAPAMSTELRDESSERLKSLTTIRLKDESLSVSAVWGKSFQADERRLGHVLDPRTGMPVTGAVLAAVVVPSATETDALSTALLTLGREGHESLARLRPGMRTLLVSERGGSYSVESNGPALVN